MDDGQGLIFVFKCLPASEDAAPLFFLVFALTAGGREVRIAIQLFHLLLHRVFNQMLASHIGEG